MGAMHTLEVHTVPCALIHGSGNYDTYLTLDGHSHGYRCSSAGNKSAPDNIWHAQNRNINTFLEECGLTRMDVLITSLTPVASEAPYKLEPVKEQENIMDMYTLSITIDGEYFVSRTSYKTLHAALVAGQRIASEVNEVGIEQDGLTILVLDDRGMVVE